MANRRKPKTFERSRRLAFQRHRAQCRFRGEAYAITEEYWNLIWSEELFTRRGMRADCLCLVRRDTNKPWAQGNLTVITRQQQLAISNKDQHGLDYQDQYLNALWSDYV